MTNLLFLVLLFPLLNRVSVHSATSSEASEYDGTPVKECCVEGMKLLPVSYSCEVRSEYIVDDAPCAAAFLHCCKAMETERVERQEDNLQLARSKRQRPSGITVSAREKFFNPLVLLF